MPIVRTFLLLSSGARAVLLIEEGKEKKDLGIRRRKDYTSRRKDYEGISIGRQLISTKDLTDDQ